MPKASIIISKRIPSLLHIAIEHPEDDLLMTTKEIANLCLLDVDWFSIWRVQQNGKDIWFFCHKQSLSSIQNLQINFTYYKLISLSFLFLQGK